jgi:predicted transcriptional regulator
MSRSIRLPGGDLEYAVLEALWDAGEASTREVYARVGEPNGLVYTTTAKVLERLRVKGLVSRKRRGRTFLYRATLPRDRIGREQARTVFSRLLLGGEPRPVMATLVDAVESIDPELLEELERIVRSRRKARRGS